jgi:hypothetical protein
MVEATRRCTALRSKQPIQPCTVHRARRPVVLDGNTSIDLARDVGQDAGADDLRLVSTTWEQRRRYLGKWAAGDDRSSIQRRPVEWLSNISPSAEEVPK